MHNLYNLRIQVDFGYQFAEVRRSTKNMTVNFFILISISVLYSVITVASVEDPPKPNEYPYKFIHQPECYREEGSFQDGELETSLKLTIVVKSSAPHFRKRMAIRETWGFEDQLWPDVSIRTVFNVGLSNSSFFGDQIDTESEIFQDILQSDFMDKYYNNTLKTVMGIKWAVSACKNTDFFFFVDDDAFVSVENLVKLIKDQNYTKESILYTGYILSSSKPFRDPENKWYVSDEEFPGTDYPPFASGVAVLYSWSGLQRIQEGIYNSNHFRFDDVFIGIAAKQSDVKPIHNENFRIYDKLNLENFMNRKNTIVSHGFQDIDEMVNMWNIFNEES